MSKLNSLIKVSGLGNAMATVNPLYKNAPGKFTNFLKKRGHINPKYTT